MRCSHFLLVIVFCGISSVQCVRMCVCAYVRMCLSLHTYADMVILLDGVNQQKAQDTPWHGIWYLCYEKRDEKKKKERIRKGCTDTRAPRVQDQSKLDLFGKVECAACVQKTDLFVGLCYLAKEKVTQK